MSTGCPNCSFPLERQHRRLLGRLLFRKTWTCRACGTRVRAWRVPFGKTVSYLGSRYTRCIVCGNPRVKRLATRDRIDRMSIHPVSVVAAALFAPIYHCNACRHQYHDWRALAPAVHAERRASSEDDRPVPVTTVVPAAAAPEIATIDELLRPHAKPEPDDPATHRESGDSPAASA